MENLYVKNLLKKLETTFHTDGKMIKTLLFKVQMTKISLTNYRWKYKLIFTQDSFIMIF